MIKLIPSDLRLNDYYVLWYSNVARLLMTCVVPFSFLVYLNSRIYKVIKRRRRLLNRPPRSSSAEQKAKETHHAIILFVIVACFITCHTLRVIINLQEIITLPQVKKSLQNGCYGFPFWILLCASISRFLMTVNSSSNFLIYCLMCQNFRKILKCLYQSLYTKGQDTEFTKRKSVFEFNQLKRFNLSDTTVNHHGGQCAGQHPHGHLSSPSQASSKGPIGKHGGYECRVSDTFEKHVEAGDLQR